jgi:hypothetical protein
MVDPYIKEAPENRFSGASFNLLLLLGALPLEA